MNKVVAMLVLVAALGLVALAAVGVRNGIITKQESVKEQWSQIDTQLQRRADLIPNLVSTVKGYAAHEETIMTEVAAARSRLLSASTPVEKSEADGALTSALGRLLMIAENYPNLKADQNFIRLQDELAGTENRVAVARTRYNEAVKRYNASIRTFPGNVLASGFERAEYFQSAPGKNVQDVPAVKF